MKNQIDSTCLTVDVAVDALQRHRNCVTDYSIRDLRLCRTFLRRELGADKLHWAPDNYGYKKIVLKKNA